MSTVTLEAILGVMLITMGGLLAMSRIAPDYRLSTVFRWLLVEGFLAAVWISVIYFGLELVR